MTDRYDRRTFIGRGVYTAAAAALLPTAAWGMLEACATSSGPRRLVTPRHGGSLVYGVEAETNSFDPRQGAWDTSGLQYARTVYDALFMQAADGTVKPHLAESITPNPDYTEWTIKLRPGINFHDGSMLDASVVKVNLDGVAQSPLTGPYLFNMSGVKVVDQLTVLVTMRTPWVPFPIYLTGQLGYMAGLKQLADTSGRAQPIGTGPFMFKEWVPGDHFTSVRNPGYWRSGLPYLDSITYRPIVDNQSREDSLRAGNVDLMHSNDTQSVANLLHDTGFNQVNDLNAPLGEPEQRCVMLNTAVPPLDDIRVRRALAYATDRQRAIDTLYNGLIKPADGPFMPGSPYYAPTGYPGYDPAKAKALVAEYERDKGPISFRYGTTTAAKNRQQNEFLQAMWKAVGIQSEIVQVEQSAYILSVISGNFQACGWRQFNNPDPDANYVWWSSTTAAPVGRQALNFARNKDREIDAALQAGRTQVDPGVRAAAYAKVAARLGADIPYVWIGPAVWMVAARKAAGGVGSATLPDGSSARGMNSGLISAAELWRQE
jgi:ABC-type transport system substrate-binding protein